MGLLIILAVPLFLVLDPQCQAMIDANMQSVQLIRTIQVDYTLVRIDEPTVPLRHVIWKRDEQRERIIATHDQSGRKMSMDILLDPETSKVLRNWTPQTPLTPTNQNRVNADVAPRTSYAYAGLSPAHQLHFEMAADPRRSLAELARVAPNIQCRGKVAAAGRDLWEISLETPEETTATTQKKRYDVFLDPSVGYSMRRIVMHRDDLLPTGKIETYSHAYEVTEYKDFGDGVYVPMRIRNGSRSDNVDHWTTELVVKSVKVNEPIPTETFEMAWPKFVLVKHWPAEKGEILFDVWGDGKPLRQFKGNADLRAFEDELRQDPKMAAELDANLATMEAVPGASSWLLRAIAATVLGAVLLVVGLAVVRHRRLKAA